VVWETPIILPLFAATIISAGLAMYAWRYRSTPGVKPFMVLMLAVAEWSLVYAFRLGGMTLPAKIFWAKVRYIGIVTVPVAWLVFVLQYTGQEKWLTRRNKAIVIGVALLTLALTWTNEVHHLIWVNIGLVPRGSMLVWHASYGWWYQIYAVYVYVLLAFGLYVLVRAFFHSARLYREQTGVLLIGALVPVVGDALTRLNLISFPLDITPFAFTVTGLMAAWAVFRFRLFDIVPMARSAVVEKINGGVFVLDLQDRVVDINPAALDIVGLPAADVIGHPLVQLMPEQFNIFDRYRGQAELHDEITLDVRGVQRHYDLRISPLYDQRARLRSRLVVIYDITERKRAEAGLRAQTRLFESLIAIARATAKHTSLEATLQSAVNMATTLTGAERGSMFLLDGTGTVTHSVLARDHATPAQQQDIVGSVTGEGLVGWVIEHRHPALIDDTLQDERWVHLPDPPYTARSAMAIPIVSGSAVLGVMTLTHPEPKYFNTEHAYLINSSIDQIVLAIRNAQMYDEQRRLADRQTTLYEALRTVGQHLDPETIAHAAVEAVARLTGWPAVAILLPDEAETHVMIRAGAGALSMTEGQRIPVGQGVTGRAFRTAQTQYVPNVSVDANYRDYTSSNVILRSELAIPMQRGERVLGVLDVASDRLAAFNDEDILLAKSLAEAIALALDNARLYVEIRQYAADLSTLYTIARTISRSLVLEDVLSEILQSALTALGFDAGVINLTDPHDGHLYLAAERGLPLAMSNRLRQEGLEETFCAYIHRQGQSMAIGDIEQETPLVRRLEKDAPLAVHMMRALGLHAYSGIALSHQDRLLGTLGMFTRQPRTLSVEDEALQMAIGQQIATAITNAQLFQTVEDERSRLQALIESSRDGIILVGADHRMLVVNAPAIDFLHLTGPPRDWVNRPIQDAMMVLGQYASRAKKIFLAEVDRVQTGDESPGGDECEIPPRTIRLMGLPVMTGTALLGRLLVLRDVTEERLLERMREDLVHAMVHDLRNPLTAIYGALAFLNDAVADALSPTQRQLWGIAQDNTQGMLKLIQAILEISRLESRQMLIDHTLVSLADLVANTLALQLPLAADKGLHLESNVQTDLPPAWADAGLVERVLQNLVGNAIKFTPSGGVVRVTAQVGTDDTGRSRIIVSVSDTGSGIPPELQERLFQKFVTGQQHGRGSGLGLAFCRMVIEAHGERIWIADTSENGTTFSFTLPLPATLEP
jgi:PAS domain S-box-containing protein